MESQSRVGVWLSTSNQFLQLERFLKMQEFAGSLSKHWIVIRISQAGRLLSLVQYRIRKDARDAIKNRDLDKITEDQTARYVLARSASLTYEV